MDTLLWWVRFDFSAPFLRIVPPDTDYGQAWEGLCRELIAADRPGNRIRRTAAPDHGIDIFDDTAGEAFQCKAVELGAAGTVSASASLESLQSALRHRQASPWKRYVFATNGRYTEAARSEIVKKAAELGLDVSADLDFLGPDHWESCCERHYDRVKERFYYRVTVDEHEVVEALRKARYYPQYVAQYGERIRASGYKVVITNNRTPVELEIPFSSDLTIKHCLDVARELLGISLEWTSFSDLNTSAGPSVSLTIDRHAQSFNKTLSEAGVQAGDKLEFWIKIVWREGERDATPSTSVLYRAYSYVWPEDGLRRMSANSARDRGELTIGRKEALLQAMIWQATARLRKPHASRDGA
jgi:hypothetical protein